MNPAVTSRRLNLHTADGVTLVAYHLPRTTPTPVIAAGPAVVVVPGFTGSAERPHVRLVAELLRPYADVVLVDPRGHGSSGGRSTLGDREALDVEAAVRATRELGYDRVATVGWSMGGSAVIRHAGLVGRGGAVGDHPVTAPVDAVVCVSAASRWHVRDTAAMRRVHLLAETRAGRVVARVGYRVRIDPHAWPRVVLQPYELVGDIAPAPLLIVHGDRDSYFTLEHPRRLYDEAREPKELWLVPGFGHAEVAATPELIDRIGRHLSGVLTDTQREPL